MGETKDAPRLEAVGMLRLKRTPARGFRWHAPCNSWWCGPSGRQVRNPGTEPHSNRSIECEFTIENTKTYALKSVDEDYRRTESERLVFGLNGQTVDSQNQLAEMLAARGSELHALADDARQRGDLEAAARLNNMGESCINAAGVVQVR